MEKAIELAYQIKNEMENDPRFLALNEAEKKMENDPDVIKLTYIKDMKEVSYNDALKHYNEDSPEIILLRKELYEAKKNLESHPLVRDYLSKYQVVRELLDEMNNILFSDLNKKMCKK